MVEVKPGARFGKLTVNQKTDQQDKYRRFLWHCSCDCGGEKLVSSNRLKNKNVRSCGCLTRPSLVKPGARFGKITVKEYTEKINKWGARLWLCECDCGNVRYYPSNTVSRIKSCGCETKPITDITGQAFGHLTALRPTNERSTGHVIWECRCDCGRMTLRSSAELKKGGNQQHCGCLTSEIAMQAFKKNIHFYNGTQIEAISSNKPPSTNTSGVRGVRIDKRTGKYRAYIYFQGKQINLGCHDNLEDAATARKEAEEKLFHPILEAYHKQLAVNRT